MTNFCMQCGAKLEDKATACSACGNPVPLTSNFINKKLVDDVKNKLQNFSSQLHVAAAKAADDIAQEAAKVNVRLSKAVGEQGAKFEQSNIHSKEDNKNVFDFLNKFTKKQKIIVVLTLILFSLVLSIDGSDGRSDADDAVDKFLHASCTFETWRTNFNRQWPGYSALKIDESTKLKQNKIAKKASDELITAQKSFGSDKKITKYIKSSEVNKNYISSRISKEGVVRFCAANNYDIDPMLFN